MPKEYSIKRPSLVFGEDIKEAFFDIVCLEKVRRSKIPMQGLMIRRDSHLFYSTMTKIQA